MSDAKTLEQEARELYGIILSAMKPETPPYHGDGESIAEFNFVQGYLAAATARDKEIEELRAKLEPTQRPAKIKRASRYEPCEECGFLLYRGKPVMHNCDKSLVIESKDAEIASLRARIAELEAQVDDCEEKMSHVPAGFFA